MLLFIRRKRATIKGNLISDELADTTRRLKNELDYHERTEILYYTESW
ncbi:hypothetical protein PB1A_0765 [Leuconostoc inhae]|uniref:Uncharacterized protein n=1 Tax=Leuconostoc inhae TaxID=178001 RepID=A0AAN2QU14_9LACO|nr:hypothetical protein KSL4_1202 [Leuconostoc inhae]CUW04886.1 hypothetical protein PL111_0694 [Leuconostoc inhae]CUW10413.1 hypothetical protein PB1A_0765 [Leuconostoc inhae]